MSLSTHHASTTRTVVEELLRRMGEYDPEPIAELYAGRDTDGVLSPTSPRPAP